MKEVLENENECFEYKLVGINIHSGTAEAGHYWSLINTDRFIIDENSEEWPLTENQKWMEFNDGNVTPYNFEEMKDECFGGEKSNENDLWGGFFKNSGYGKSAYVLVYEKRKKKPIKLLVNPSPECADTAPSREI